MPDAGLLLDPAVRSTILPQIPICDQMGWDNLTAVMSLWTFNSLRCIPRRGWESCCAGGCCTNEEQVPAWEHSSAEHFVACWIFREWGWGKKAQVLILIQVTGFTSVKQASLPDNMGSRKICVCSRMFFLCWPVRKHCQTRENRRTAGGVSWVETGVTVSILSRNLGLL